jgi:hypothetical protein
MLFQQSSYAPRLSISLVIRSRSLAILTSAPTRYSPPVRAPSFPRGIFLSRAIGCHTHAAPAQSWPRAAVGLATEGHERG